MRRTLHDRLGFAQSTESDTTTDATRRCILQLLVLILALETTSIVLHRGFMAHQLIVRGLSLLAIIGLVKLMHCFVTHAKPSIYTSRALYASVAFLLFHQVLRFTNKIPAMDDLPLFGQRSALHEHLLHVLEPAGFAFLLSGLLLTGVEVFREREKIRIQHEKLRSQVEAESAIRTLEEELRCVFDVVKDYVMRISPSGEILAINRTVEGISVEAAIGTRIYDYMPHDEAARIKGIVRRVIETRAPENYDLTALGNNGVISAYSCRMGPVLEGGIVTSLVVVGSDISEKRTTQEVLAGIVEGTCNTVGQEFFRSLVRQLAIALNMRYVIVGKLNQPHGGRIQSLAYWNDGAYGEAIEYDLAGTPCEDVLNRTVCSHSQNVSQKYPKDQMLVDLGIESYLGAPLHNNAGEAIGLLAVMDVKPRDDSAIAQSILTIFGERAAAELDRQNAEQKRRELEAQIQYAQKLESLGVLAGGIAHDFNNLLVAIQGFNSLALAEITEDDPIRKHLVEIDTASQRAAELTHQMLAYSGNGHFITERIDVKALIEELMNLLRASISKKARLHCAHAIGLPPITGDATQIRQIVMNLVTNASDALGAIPGDISVSTAPVGAETVARSEAFVGGILLPGEYILIEVSDTGSGMDEAVRRRMFDPFYTTKFTGRGLGLAAVLGIVRGHNGAIAVESAPGKGTCVRVYLPVENEAAQTNETPKTALPQPFSPTSDNRGGTVLFADDEDYIRKLARRVLESVGYSVLEARDGAEAVRLFRENAELVEAVILDLTMPGLSGEEAYKEIRGIREDAQVLLSSGYTDEDLALRMESQGARGFLPKPYRAETLVEKVRALLAG